MLMKYNQGKARQPKAGRGGCRRARFMGTVYDIVTVTCFACVVLTYFMFTEGGMKVLAHFMLPAAAFAIANQLGNAGMPFWQEFAAHGINFAIANQPSNAGMNVLAIILIAAGIAYTYIIVRH
jgi:hypothetical protein